MAHKQPVTLISKCSVSEQDKKTDGALANPGLPGRQWLEIEVGKSVFVSMCNICVMQYNGYL